MNLKYDKNFQKHNVKSAYIKKSQYNIDLNTYIIANKHFKTNNFFLNI